MNTNWADVIAEPPYDEMGKVFAKTFRTWLTDAVRFAEVSQDARSAVWMLGGNAFDDMVFDIFGKRLEIAKKYGTYFARQMADGVWKDRYRGVGYTPCYSFAIEGLERTERFYRWAEQVYGNRRPDSYRVWDTDIAPLPHLPNEANGMVPGIPMPVWEHRYYPHHEARAGGSLNMRIIRYSQNTYLFEHVRNNWVPLMRDEAKSWWTRAFFSQDPLALAAFEWCWIRTNPFGRCAALTGDAMSLLVQHVHAWKIRPSFYHQDQEALLLPFNDYRTKRARDLVNGFSPQFEM